MNGGGHPWIGACSSVCSTELSSTHLDPWSDFRQRDLVESAELWKIWAHVLPQKPLFFHLQKDARSYAGLPESLCGLRDVTDMKELCNRDDDEVCVSHAPWPDVGGCAEGRVLRALACCRESCCHHPLFTPVLQGRWAQAACPQCWQN